MKVEQKDTESMVLDSDVPVVGDEIDIASEQKDTETLQPTTCAELFDSSMKSGMLAPLTS